MTPSVSVISIKSILHMTYTAGLLDLNRCSLCQLSQSQIQLKILHAYFDFNEAKTWTVLERV